MLRKPGNDEYSSVLEGYMALVPANGNLIEHFRQQEVRINGLLGGLEAGLESYRYAEGKWSVKQVVGHLADAERVLTYRLLCIARGEQQMLPGFDEEAYASVADFDSRPLAELLEELSAIRSSTVMLIRGIPEQAWLRSGKANGKSISARGLAYMVYGHTEHHLHILKSRYGIG